MIPSDQWESSNCILIENSNLKRSLASVTLKTLLVRSSYLTNPSVLHPHVRYIMHIYIFGPLSFFICFLNEKYSLKPNVHLCSLV